MLYNYLLFYKVKKNVNCYNSQYTYSDEELRNNSLKSYLPKSHTFLIVQNTSVNVYSAPCILQWLPPVILHHFTSVLIFSFGPSLDRLGLIGGWQIKGNVMYPGCSLLNHRSSSTLQFFFWNAAFPLVPHSTGLYLACEGDGEERISWRVLLFPRSYYLV